jgi:hypothetical protein
MRSIARHATILLILAVASAAAFADQADQYVAAGP